MGFLQLITLPCLPRIRQSKPAIDDVYSIPLHSLAGNPVHLSDFKGKKMLFVNVASKCGFTPQYKMLQALHEREKEQLVIIGLPCNQFGKQEPGSSEEIQSFCTKNYGVDFLLTEKVDVKGPNQHPLYQWLTQKSKNGTANSTVKWNFQKYLVNEKGELEAVYSSLKSF